MKTWLRVVLSPEQYLGYVIVYLVVAGIPYAFLVANGGAVPFPLDSEFGLAVPCGMAAMYGAYRVGAFHPALRPDYRKWLVHTPWRFGLPLPIGPVHLVPQDLVYVAATTAITFLHRDVRLMMVPTAFAALYLASTLLALLAAGQGLHAWLLAFGLGGVPLLWDYPPALAGLLAALCLVAWHGNRAALRRLREWKIEGGEADSWVQANMTQEAQRRRILGWPFDRLGPQRHPWALDRTGTVAVAVLFGWYWFVGIALSPMNGKVAGLAFACMLGMVLAMVRLVIYLVGFAPPISLLGRLVTFRWIIPGYDIVFATPAFIVFLAVSSTAAVVQFHLPPEVVAPLLVTAEIIVAGAFPPSLDQWRLTGHHRIVPAAAAQGNELQQTQ